MTANFMVILMCILFLTTSVALWHTLTVVNHMSKDTRHSIRWAYILRSTGLFLLLLAVADYLIGNPMTWPWMLLVAVALATAGSAMLHLASRNSCRCVECPIRGTSLDTPCMGKDRVL